MASGHRVELEAHVQDVCSRPHGGSHRLGQTLGDLSRKHGAAEHRCAHCREAEQKGVRTETKDALSLSHKHRGGERRVLRRGRREQRAGSSLVDDEDPGGCQAGMTLRNRPVDEPDGHLPPALAPSQSAGEAGLPSEDASPACRGRTYQGNGPRQHDSVSADRPSLQDLAHAQDLALVLAEVPGADVEADVEPLIIARDSLWRRQTSVNTLETRIRVPPGRISRGSRGGRRRDPDRWRRARRSSAWLEGSPRARPPSVPPAPGRADRWASGE